MGKVSCRQQVDTVYDAIARLATLATLARLFDFNMNGFMQLAGGREFAFRLSVVASCVFGLAQDETGQQRNHRRNSI